MTKVILVRHGETDWNKVHRLQGGASDTPLNDTGQHQAGKLASRLASEKILAVYSSPLQRAAYTAQLIAASHGLDIKIVQELKEICLGNLEGFPSTQLPESFENYIAQNKHLSQNEDRGAESIENVQKRAWQAVKAITTEYPGGIIVAVSHFRDRLPGMPRSRSTFGPHRQTTIKSRDINHLRFGDGWLRPFGSLQWTRVESREIAKSVLLTSDNLALSSIFLGAPAFCLCGIKKA